jgi:hypothetical protein
MTGFWRTTRSIASTYGVSPSLISVSSAVTGSPAPDSVTKRVTDIATSLTGLPSIVQPARHLRSEMRREPLLAPTKQPKLKSFSP